MWTEFASPKAISVRESAVVSETVLGCSLGSMATGGDRVLLCEGSDNAIPVFGGEEWALEDTMTRARNEKIE